MIHRLVPTTISFQNTAICDISTGKVVHYEHIITLDGILLIDGITEIPIHTLLQRDESKALISVIQGIGSRLLKEIGTAVKKYEESEPR